MPRVSTTVVADGDVARSGDGFRARFLPVLATSCSLSSVVDERATRWHRPSSARRDKRVAVRWCLAPALLRPTQGDRCVRDAGAGVPLLQSHRPLLHPEIPLRQTRIAGRQQFVALDDQPFRRSGGGVAVVGVAGDLRPLLLRPRPLRHERRDERAAAPSALALARCCGRRGRFFLTLASFFTPRRGSRLFSPTNRLVNQTGTKAVVLFANGRCSGRRFEVEVVHELRQRARPSLAIGVWLSVRLRWASRPFCTRLRLVARGTLRRTRRLTLFRVGATSAAATAPPTSTAS